MGLEKMKFTKKALATIFILLIAFDSLSASKTVMNKLIEHITSPLNISYFLMGILSEWISEVDNLYYQVKKVEKILKPCEKTIEALWELIEGKPTTDKEKQKEQKKLKEKEEDMSNESAKYKKKNE